MYIVQVRYLQDNRTAAKVVISSVSMYNVLWDMG